MAVRGALALVFAGLAAAGPGRDEPLLLHVLDAEVIALVRREGDDTFRVEEVFLGPRSVGDVLRLPGFRLVWRRGGKGRRPVLAEFLPETRVLLCLDEQQPTTRQWYERQGRWAAWANDGEGVAHLRERALRAVALRRRWEEACATPDESERFGKLWPWLWEFDYGFRRHTIEEMVRMGETAGPLLAERLPALEYDRLSCLLPECGRIGSRPLHDALVRHLKARQRGFAEWCERNGRDPCTVLDDWNECPAEPRDAYGELYSGLCGLVKFRDPADLPYIRSLALWSAHHRFLQVSEEALNGFHYMPDAANLPAIEAIVMEYWTRPDTGSPLSPHLVVRALGTHRMAEAVPLLAGLLTSRTPPGVAPEIMRSAREEAHDVLKAIVGQDLGPTAGPWLAWHRKRG